MYGIYADQLGWWHSPMAVPDRSCLQSTDPEPRGVQVSRTSVLSSESLGSLGTEPVFRAPRLAPCIQWMFSWRAPELSSIPSTCSSPSIWFPTNGVSQASSQKQAWKWQGALCLFFEFMLWFNMQMHANSFPFLLGFKRKLSSSFLINLHQHLWDMAFVSPKQVDGMVLIYRRTSMYCQLSKM